jgi:RNA polymerase sigma-70 factor (ECF subfamily)
LYGVARNLTRSRLRRERRFVRIDAVEERAGAGEDDPGAALAGSQERDRLRRAIAALPSRYREVVILCGLHGLSYADAAAVLGIPLGTVRSRLNRGRRAIADRLRDVNERGMLYEQPRRVVG